MEGSHPFRVTFVKGLGGRDMPELVADSSNLIGSGNFKPVVYVETIVEGRTAPAENAVIDTDPRVEQVTSESGSQLWARMNGVRFKHYIPRYTKSGRFEITASGVDKGQMTLTLEGVEVDGEDCSILGGSSHDFERDMFPITPEDRYNWELEDSGKFGFRA